LLTDPGTAPSIAASVELEHNDGGSLVSMRIGVTVDGTPNEEGVVVERALRSLGDIHFLTADATLPARLEVERPDIVLNLARGEGNPERRLHVSAFLEYFAIPFTGSDSVTHATCVARARMKAALAAHGVPTASYAVIDRPSQLAPYARRAFPVSVRRERGVSSCHATLIAHDYDELESIVAELFGVSPEPVLIERFLPGESFACGILGNGTTAVMLPAVGIPNDPFAPTATSTGGVPLCADGLAEEVESIALRAFHALGCRDVARIDIRLSDSGVPNVCAVDTNPSLTRAGDQALVTAARAAGLAEEELVQRCLLLAAERCGVNMPSAPPLPRLARRTPTAGTRIRSLAS